MDRIDKVLAEIEKEVAKGERFLPIVGPEKGKFDFLVAKAIGARKVLDLGTLVGYSALLFSKAVGRSGKVVTVEMDGAIADEAERNFARAGVKNIKLLRGDAEEILAGLKDGEFDLVLLDIEKRQYAKVFPDCVRVLRKGGVILTDNALWNTNDLKAFRKLLEKGDGADSVLVPIADGIAMSVKV